MKRVLIKTLKITGTALIFITLLLLILPMIFPGQVNEKIKSWTNNTIKGKLDFSGVRLSFFNHFPSLTLTMYDVSLLGSRPFEKDTLIASKEIAFGLNIRKMLFDKEIIINKIFLSKAVINIHVNEKGEPNYNVYETLKKTDVNIDADSAGTSLKLEKIQIDNSEFYYDDRSVDFILHARGFNYTGTGDLSKDIFDLYTHAEIDSLDLILAKEEYLKNKKINADLITKINTHSLALVFEKNDLKINQLPIDFNGKLNFLKNGYEIAMRLKSTNSPLNDFVTAFPPQYLTWQEQTKIKGFTDLDFELNGNYIASTGEMPEARFKMQIRDGYISHKKAPVPVENIFFNMNVDMPALNTDSLSINIDSIYFSVEKSYLQGRIKTTGINQPFVNTALHAEIDLEKLDHAAGIPALNLKGNLELDLNANGKYSFGTDTSSIRNKSILTSIPSFKLDAKLREGYFKYDSLPLAVDKINFQLASICSTSDYRDAGISINDLTAQVLNHYIKGYARIKSIKEKNIDLALKGDLSLADIQKIYPLENIQLGGDLTFDINSKGELNPEKKSFPVTTADIRLQNGKIQTAYYPAPVEDINVIATVTDNTGTMQGVHIDIDDAKLNFEGKPFALNADLKNLDDILYHITAKGDLDIGRIYKVFAVKNTDVEGTVSANLSLQGRQSDATSGRIQNLKNRGEIKINHIRFDSDYFPQPFLLKNGILKFNQDKIWLEPFEASYGHSTFHIKGYVQDIFPYLFNSNGILKGYFGLTAGNVFMDELMAYSSTEPAEKDSSATENLPHEGENSGTILVPSNLDFVFNLNVEKLHYREIILEQVKSDAVIQNGSFQFSNTGFTLIGCKVNMEGVYSSSRPTSAYFEYRLNAEDFDIKKAYQQVSIFRNLAPAAANASGIVSIDYALKGKLNETMEPVFPSLEGGGSIYLKDVKVKGMKLFSAVSRKTGKDSINNPRLTKVRINSTIRKNVIDIERFKFKVFGFRTRIEGQTSFDGKIKFAMRLGLPPFGLIGIPMRVSGTHEEPVIKMGKTDSEPIEETEMEEEGRE